MDAIDRALEESLRRRREGDEGAVRAAGVAGGAGAVGAGAAAPAPRKAAFEREAQPTPDPFSPEVALLRAESEDDDGYDPYSDYMDQLARGSSYDDELEEDPWR